MDHRPSVLDNYARTTHNNPDISRCLMAYIIWTLNSYRWKTESLHFVSDYVQRIRRITNVSDWQWLTFRSTIHSGCDFVQCFFTRSMYVWRISKRRHSGIHMYIFILLNVTANKYFSYQLCIFILIDPFIRFFDVNCIYASRVKDGCIYFMLRLLNLIKGILICCRCHQNNLNSFSFWLSGFAEMRFLYVRMAVSAFAKLRNNTNAFCFVFQVEPRSPEESLRDRILAIWLRCSKSNWIV